MKKGTFLLAVFISTVIACSKSSDSTTTTTTVDCSGTTKSYTSDVAPIVQSYCATSGCHASGSSNGPGALTTYAQVYSARAAIRVAIANGTMPQGSSLSTTQKNTILCWIDNGAADN